ncbi:MAG: hypothetical protein SF097_17740 [Acidobacteriota bacterium]|nr:hypothetical protein [Acidobacteriota bacterium]
MSEEKINSSNQTDQSDAPSWEAQLQARANEFLNQRVGTLKSEIERLQSTIAEIGAKLTEQAQPVATPEESSGLLDYVRQLFSDSTSKAEQDFEKRLTDAQQSNETEFQKRLENACSEAAAIARRESESQIEDLREQLDASRKALTLAVSSSQSAASQASSLEQLKSAIEEIDSQRTQSDTLAALVRRASQFSPRIVFFVVKGNEAVGWKASGFDNGLNDETVRLLSVGTQNQTLLREALTTFNVAKARSASPGENSAVLGLYGSPAPETAVAIPLVVRGKAAAVLYADSGTQSENDIAAAALETLMRVASMGIELLPSRRGVEPVRPAGPPPQLSTPSTSASATAAAMAPEPVAAPEPVVPPTPEPVVAAPIVEAPKPVAPVVEAVESYVADELAEPKRITEELPPPEFTPQLSNFAGTEPALHSAKTEPDIEEVAETPEPEPSEPVAAPTPIFEHPRFEAVAPPPPPPAPPIYAAPSQNDFPLPVAAETPKFEPPAIEPPAFTSPVVEAPRPAQPVMAIPTATSETEQRAHNDARRFARLLVSEIKLYNAAKVTEGRRSLDLYDRLRDEIDRSRKVYDKRVSPAVATRFDYFYDELVQTLAEGDDAKLGPNCPGPVVQ